MNEYPTSEPLKLRLSNFLEELEIALEMYEDEIAEISANIDDLKAALVQKQICRNSTNEKIKATDKLLEALR
jgi:prefoldin subunit 5